MFTLVIYQWAEMPNIMQEKTKMRKWKLFLIRIMMEMTNEYLMLHLLNLNLFLIIE